MSQTGQSASISVGVTGLTGALATSSVQGEPAMYPDILTDATAAPLLDASNNPLTSPTYFTGQTAAQIA